MTVINTTNNNQLHRENQELKKMVEAAKTIVFKDWISMFNDHECMIKLMQVFGEQPK